jgi:hypothetical protein
MNPITVYLYELRRSEEIVATGHVTYEQPVEIGGRITVASREGIIREIIPILGQRA